MTKTTERVLALLEILQAGGIRTVADLAGRLEVDERTVRRYAAQLSDLGVPVRTRRGRYGGYQMSPGYRMPPLMLTDDEALAALWGLVTADRAGQLPTAVAAAESAAAKVRRVLPTALRLRLDSLLRSTAFSSPPRGRAAIETETLLVLGQAVELRRAVAIGYTDAGGRTSRRIVSAYGLVAHQGRWYLLGADSRTSQIRNFRLDRISDPVLRAEIFEPPPGFDPAEHLLTAFAEAPYRHLVSLRVQGRPDEVLAALPAGLATVQDEDGTGWVRVRIGAERLDWIPGLLAGSGLNFRVEGPDALRDLIQDLGLRLIAAAEG